MGNNKITLEYNTSNLNVFYHQIIEKIFEQNNLNIENYDYNISIDEKSNYPLYDIKEMNIEINSIIELEDEIIVEYLFKK